MSDQNQPTQPDTDDDDLLDPDEEGIDDAERQRRTNQRDQRQSQR